MTRRVLVIGGTGPTGPHVIAGLLRRGDHVTMLHRGVHEPAGLPDVPHLHADPHFVDSLAAAVGTRDFDVVVGMYGRTAVTAEVFAGRADHVVCIGGVPVYRGVVDPERFRPSGAAVPLREDGPLEPVTGPGPSVIQRMVAAEQALLDRARRGAYRATLVRYPSVYGPRNVVPWEWTVLKRVRDGRPFIILPDGGLGIMSRCAAANAAALVLAVVDHPDAANGEAYHCADREQYTFRQWVELIVGYVGADLDVVSLPTELAEAAQAALMPLAGIRPHVFVDASKATTELGYTEVVTAGAAIRESVDWLRAHPPDGGVWVPDRFDYEREDRLVTAYGRAVAMVREETGLCAPELDHPMPHPREPSLGVDHRGR